MEKRTVATRLDEETRAWLEGEAKRRGLSQSAALEQVVLAARSAVASSTRGAPGPERVPSPQETGTAHWREPTEEEVESARERYPGLPEDRLMRLARAEARQVDMGVPQPKKDPSREEIRERAAARANLFRTFRTLDSTKGIKPKESA